MRFRRQELRLHSRALRSRPDLPDQLGGNFWHARGNILRLGQKIKRAQRQRLEGDRRPSGAMRTDHDYRQPPASHDFFQSIDPVPSGHFQVERYHLRRQVLDFLQRKMAVHRRAHNLDRVIPFENVGNQLAHQSRIIHHQDPHWFSHAWPPAVPRARISPAWIPPTLDVDLAGTALDSRPAIRDPVASARPRVKRSIRAIMFRMRTTLPSPRIEAPLTRSVVIDWSSSPLMTSSSSPSSPSTMTPNLRSPLLITSTKTLRRAVSGPLGGCEPRRSRGNTSLRSCRTSWGSP